MVRAHSGPPKIPEESRAGDIAQLGERLPCKQEVAGSNPTISTIEIKSKHLMGIKCFDLTSKESDASLVPIAENEFSAKRRRNGLCDDAAHLEN